MMHGMMMALMVWTAAYLGVPVPEEVPNLQPASQRDLWIIATGSDHGFVDDGQIKYAALYAEEVKTIYIDESAEPGNIYWLSVVVHELTHYLQYENGHDKTVECRQRLEQPAHEAQEAFLKPLGLSMFTDAGEDPRRPFRINALFAAMVSSCPRTPFMGEER